MIYAVYRPLYGEDFILESMASIINHVDKIFFCYSDVAFGGVTEVEYKGKSIKFPLRKDNTIDNSLALVKGFKEKFPDKIEIIKQDGTEVDGQFTRIVNELILPNYPRPDVFMFIEPDQVFRLDQIQETLDLFKMNTFRTAQTRQVELWRLPDWRIPERLRTGVVFWKVDKKDLPETRKQGEPKSGSLIMLPTFVHNFGFCMAPHLMELKFLLGLAFSKKIKDSEPNENWFAAKWLQWHPIANNVALEISKGHESNIARADPYDRVALPDIIRRKYGY